MARAEVRPKLPLDVWAKNMGLNPLHFNGVYIEDRPPATCEQPWLQFAWQTADRVGREEIARAILQAEADIERFLGYRLLPAWEEDEWRDTVRPTQKELFNLTSTEIRSFAQAVKANWGHMVTGGVRANELLEADSTITYTDPDGDGYAELATVTATVVAGQDPCEIRIYFPVSNGMVATGAEDQWEIRPTNVSVSGTTATITFRRELAVLPELQLDIVPDADDSHLRGVIGTVDANFLATVDVYRVYNDPQTQVLMMWETLGLGCDNCAGNGCAQCQYSTQTGCFTARGDIKQGLVGYRPATWNSTNLEFDAAALAVARQPDIVRLWYFAGLREKGLTCSILEMSKEWEQVVSRYATAILDRMVCACTNVHSNVEYWQQDLAIRGKEGLFVPRDQLDNPFGTRRGAVAAWQKVTANGAAIGRAVSPL